MCHHRLGDKAKAKSYYERATRSYQEHEMRYSPQWREDLQAFRAEAEAVLTQP
jgi:hypothetical protein